MRNLRAYTIDGKQAIFHKEAFRYLVTQKSRKEKVAKSKLEVQIAENIGVSANTVHKWLYNGGGPMDVALIGPLATALGIADPTELLIFTDDGGTEMEKLTDRQKNAVKRIYDICIWFLYEFNQTDGFNACWDDFQDAGSEDPEEDIYDMVEKMLGKVRMVLDQEYFDLRDCEIYDALCDYVSEDLYNTFSGKLSYAYRFEAMVDGNPTTTQDFDRAMIRLNTIIDQYQ